MHIIDAFGATKLVDAHDVGMAQTGDRASLTLEALGIFFLSGRRKIATDHLDGGVAIEVLIIPLVHARHAAPTEQALDGVIT